MNNKKLFQLPASITFIILFVCFITICKAQSTPKKSLLALSKANHTLAVVDAATLNVIARIPVGQDPHEVIASADGKTAYVSIYGGGSLHEIDVLDLVAQKPLTYIDTKPLLGPHGLIFVKDKLWFTAEGSKAIGSYNPATGNIDWIMGTGQDRTHMIFVAANAKKIYTTNVASGTVSILIDTLISFMGMPPAPNDKNNNPQQQRQTPPGFGGQHENWVQTIVPTARGAEGFDVSPDSTELWTASAEDGNIYVVNLTAKKLVDKIDAKVQGANRLKFTPDGKLVFISSLGSGSLTVYDAKSRKQIKQINIGHGAAGILMDTNGSRAFVACTADNYVAVIDLKTLEITNKIDVGGEPDGLAWAIIR